MSRDYWLCWIYFVTVIAGCSVYEPLSPDTGSGGTGGQPEIAGSGVGGSVDTSGDGIGGADIGGAGGSTGSGGDGGSGTISSGGAGMGDDGGADALVDGAGDVTDSNSRDSSFRDSTGNPSDAPGDVEGECVRESRSEFCLRAFKNCESVTALDNCGISTTFDCGVCVPLEACGGTGTPNVCGAPVNLVVPGGTVTASNMGIPPEDMTKAFDDDGATKWFTSPVSMPWVAYQFPGGATHVVTSYGITSGNDSPVRDPKNWQLQASNDGMTWMTLDTRTGETFPNRLQMKIYPCTGTAAYSRFRFFVTAINAGTEFQVEEIQLFGN